MLYRNNSDSWLIDLSEPEPQLGQIRITSNPMTTTTTTTTTTTIFTSSTNEPILNSSTTSNKGKSYIYVYIHTHIYRRFLPFRKLLSYLFSLLEKSTIDDLLSFD